MSYILDQWRKASPALADLSDEQLIPIVHQATGDARPLAEFASALDYKAPKSDLSKELSAGWANYKAGMEHIGAALGSETAARWADQNTARANMLREMSNAPHSFDEVQFGDKDKGVLNYIGQLGASSLPYLAEQAAWAAGDVVTGGALTPAHALRLGRAATELGLGARGIARATEAGIARGATESVAAAAAREQAARGIARGVTGAEVSYPSSVGDILSNQYEQAGTYDPAAAFAFGVPYAAANALGLEGAVSRRGLPIAHTIQNRAGRAAATGLMSGLSEAGNESFQEVMNQAGRVAVDPNASMTSPEALARYKESAIGGFVLGKVTGTAGGAFSSAYKPLGNQTGQQDQSSPLMLENNPTPSVAFPDGTVATHPNDITNYLSQFDPEQRKIELDRLMSRQGRGPVTGNMTEHYDLLDQERNRIDAERARIAATYSPQGDLFDTYNPAPAEAPAAHSRDDLVAWNNQLDAEYTATRQGQLANPRPIEDIIRDINAARSALSAMPTDGNQNQASLFNNRGEPVVDEYTAGGRGRREYRSITPPELLAQQRIERAAGVAAPAQTQPIILPGQEQPATAQPIAAPRTETLDQQLEARRKAARGEVLSANEAFLLTQPLAQANPNATIETPRPANRQQVQGDMFPSIERGPVAPLAAPQGAQVATADPNQREMFDAKGRTTLAAAASNPATNDEVAAQFGKEFGVKPTEKRKATMATVGRLYYDGKIDFDAAQGVALTLQSGKYAAAEREVAALRSKANETTKQIVAKDGTKVTLKNVVLNEDNSRITAYDEHGNELGGMLYSAVEESPGIRVNPSVEVEPHARRKGIASAMYDFAEENGGLIPAVDQKGQMRTDDGIAFRNAREKAKTAPAVQEQHADTVVEKPKPNDADLMKQLVAVRDNPNLSDSEREQQMDAIRAQIEELDNAALENYQETNAEEAFNDTDVFHDGDGPKYADLAPDLKKRWDAAVEAGKANQALHDSLSNAQRMSNMAKGLTKYRIAEDEHGYVSPDTARAVVEEVQSKWKNAPEIVLVENRGGLPAALRTQMEKDNATNAKGAFWNGKVYVISDHASSAADLVATILHEVTGHFGLHGVLGSKLDAVMNQIYNTNAEIRAAADQMVKEEGLERNVAVEEVLADMAERGDVAPNLLEKIANAVRQFLRSIGLGKYVSGVTNGEVKELMVKAREFVQYGEATSMEGDLSPVYRQGALPDAPPAASFVANLVDNIKHIGTSSGMLGLLTMRQLADRFKNVTGVKEFTDTVTAMSVMAKKLQGEVAAIDHLWAQMDNVTEARPLMSIMLEATMNQFHVDQEFTHADNAHIDPTMKPEFDALRQKYLDLIKKNPVAERIYTETRKKFADDWKKTGELIKGRIIDQYKPELGEELHGKALEDVAVMKEGERITFMAQMKTAAERRSLRDLWDDMDAHTYELSKMKGPYFPLMRFGDHVVVVKSTRLRDAVAALDVAKANLAKLMQQEDDTYTEDEMKAAKKAVTKARGIVENLKGDEDHYVVEFYEKRKDAENREQQLKKAFAGNAAGLEVTRSLREQHFRSMDSAPYGFMQKLEASIKENLPAKDASAIESAIRQLYIQSMPERSAMRQQLRRLNTAGVKSNEMRRSVVAAGLRNSFNISRLQYGTQLNDTLGKLRRGATDEQKLLGEELAKRVLLTMEQPTSNRLIDGLSNLSYTTFLGMSPSFLALNLTQPWTVSVPLLAARHNWKESGAAMSRATLEVAQMMAQSAKEQKTWRFTLNLDLVKDPAEKRLLHELFDKGIIDVTQEYDLGALAAGKDETWSGKLVKLASIPAHHTEVVNRVATALAAYRLELEKNPSAHSEAVAYAEKIIADSHLDYTAENSPRLLRSQSLGGLGKLVFQFKKYQQGMLFLTFKTLKDGLAPREGMTADERMEAKESLKAFSYLMGAQIGAAGIAATPFTGILAAGAWIAGKLFGEPDEDKEYKQRFYEGLKSTVGETMARLIMKGAPAALLDTDVSGRLGMGDMLDPLRYMGDAKNGKDWMAQAILALSGPTAAMGANYADALMAPDAGRAVAAALPRFMGGPLKAWQASEHGLETRRGNQYAKPEDMGTWDTWAPAFGFKSTDMSDLSERRMALDHAVAKREEYRHQLLNEFTRARLHGDDMDGVMEKIAAFNERHTAPGERSVRITQSTLQKALVSQRRYEKDLRNGVRVRKQDVSLAQDIGVTGEN